MCDERGDQSDGILTFINHIYRIYLFIFRF